ncbi:hypothetical protein HDU97_000723, partial [Phlyctochytrium planicorne]
MATKGCFDAIASIGVASSRITCQPIVLDVDPMELAGINEGSVKMQLSVLYLNGSVIASGAEGGNVTVARKKLVDVYDSMPLHSIVYEPELVPVTYLIATSYPQATISIVD